MFVFLTGATGFIGSAIGAELQQAGHRVLGLTRSDAGARALTAAGAEVHRGSLEDLESLRIGAARADAVIHCAFDHDFTNFAANCTKDEAAITALGETLAGSGKAFIVSGGLNAIAAGRLPTEDDAVAANSPLPRVSEQTAMSFVSREVSAGVMRLSQIHDTRKQGLVTYFINIAREKGVSAYIDSGANRFAAAHVSDVARLYRLALERHTPGARYHAVAEEGIRMRDIAEAVGQVLGIPTVSIPQSEAATHFGFMSYFAGMELAASSALTQQRLDWRPVGPTLLEDIAHLQDAVAS